MNSLPSPGRGKSGPESEKFGPTPRLARNIVAATPDCNANARPIWRAGATAPPAPCGRASARLREHLSARTQHHDRTRQNRVPAARFRDPCGGSPTRSSGSPRRPAPAPTSAPPTPSSGIPSRGLVAVPRVNRVDMSLLKGIDRMRDILVENTERFARGLPANNALLWGARGMGKSSLVKAAHAGVNAGARRQGRAAQAGRNPPRGHREPARADDGAARRSPTASSCSATICRSTPTTPPTSRSRRCSKAASRAGPRTSSSMPRRTAAT